MTSLSNQLVRQEAEEVARGVRVLLGSPMLVAARDRDAFDLVRRRRGALEKWFDYYCGWRLVVEARHGYARLVKIHDRPDTTRPARRHRSGKAPFDRRRYTLLCVLAAELLSGPVTTIGLLAERIVQATLNEERIPTFDSARRDERSAFVDALKLLERLGAVVATDGVTETFLEHEDAKVLYRVDATLLLRLVAAPVAPSRIAAELAEASDAATSVAEEADGEDLAAGASGGEHAAAEPIISGAEFGERLARLRREARYGDAADPDSGTSEVQRNLWLRHSVMRRLLNEPVVYRADLSAEQIAYLDSPTGHRLVRRAAEQAGFVFEERAEGVLLVDPDSIATDDRFPDDRSNAKVAALLLLDHLVAGGRPLDRPALVAHAERILTAAPAWAARAYQSDGGAARLVNEGIGMLCAFGLARSEDSGVRSLPAAARYTVERPDPQASGDEHAAD
ncbi:TIGR02678 family protein [Allosalinactinospora lopnorensis]|uniref:TIGR02678 family protein n=1 Tax=Allosalinactinospora lopnorensis TaxID=1352348 RepID=UPI000623D090|nr:TIGR02678 family protein [Allosalinactinospora lopnorensis]